MSEPTAQERIAQLKTERQQIISRRDNIAAILADCHRQRVDIAKSPVLSKLPGELCRLDDDLECNAREIGSLTLVPVMPSLEQLFMLGSLLPPMTLQEREAIDAVVVHTGRRVAGDKSP